MLGHFIFSGIFVALLPYSQIVTSSPITKPYPSIYGLVNLQVHHFYYLLYYLHFFLVFFLLIITSHAFLLFSCIFCYPIPNFLFTLLSYQLSILTAFFGKTNTVNNLAVYLTKSRSLSIFSRIVYEFWTFWILEATFFSFLFLPDIFQSRMNRSDQTPPYTTQLNIM